MIKRYSILKTLLRMYVLEGYSGDYRVGLCRRDGDVILSEIVHMKLIDAIKQEARYEGAKDKSKVPQQM